MNGEQKFWVIFWGIVITGIVFIVITGYIYCYKIESKYIANGYEKRAILGSDNPGWQLVKKGER